MNLLYWNIQNLSAEKYQEADVQTVISNALLPGVGPPFAWVPDIIVIVEVHTRAANQQPGQIYQTDGTTGLSLIAGLMAAIDNNYQCVPPVSTGTGYYSEAVGLIYNSAIFTFQGPHVWSNFGPVPATEIGCNFATATPPWNRFLQGAINQGAVNPTFQLAAYPNPWDVGPFQDLGVALPAPQIFYPDALNTSFVGFPYPWNRSPVRFLLTYPNGAAINTLDIFAVHTSPSTVDDVNQATLGTAAVAGLAEVTAAPGANGAKLVLGDFNVPTNNAGGAYAGFFANQYLAAIGNNGFEAVGTPTLFNTGNPRPDDFNYLNWNRGSIDNIFYRSNGIVFNNFGIIDQVSGSIFNGTPWASELQTQIGNYGANATNSFRGWDNFGHIAIRIATGASQQRLGASDHLPLVLSF
ncbi:endonuclease/exonuclease/phosphatase family protein [Azospirillum lipoferum]|uniref:Endonuclease/exonuclease/phosphatase domain-containing protein n=1 Tax=Azospirillum lipoferum (strain 4B) TaxID=862719 RepID=G7ZE32_AZOL4|nr:endonuclease/exonuclease/phosphatase family protein [Azospirillum lipoferum]CBS89291.1 protein of unknown function [Azospirillum lipoferum 4B]